jgi:DNA-binding CsgD family transcriptional regulator
MLVDPTRDPHPSLATAADGVLAERAIPADLIARLNRCVFPMLTVDADRRFIDVNRAARLLVRRTLAEMRALRIDDLTRPGQISDLEFAWSVLVGEGRVSGAYEVVFPDGTGLNIVYWALANALPSVHLILFAPAEWPDDELARLAGDGVEPAVELTPREYEVLSLIALGYSAPRVAETLVIGPSTVKTHLANIYEKLGVSDRAGAVAKAIRLGLIE